MDLGNTADRIQAIESLWQKTKRFLILVELGNSLGYRAIIEARDHILGLDRSGKKPRSNQKLDEALKGGTVVAPVGSVCPTCAKWCRKDYEIWLTCVTTYRWPYECGERLICPLGREICCIKQQCAS